MTQDKETVRKIAELNTIFLGLNDKGKDSALTILKALDFAQSVMCQEDRPSPKICSGAEADEK